MRSSNTRSYLDFQFHVCIIVGNKNNGRYSEQDLYNDLIYLGCKLWNDRFTAYNSFSSACYPLIKFHLLIPNYKAKFIILSATTIFT